MVELTVNVVDLVVWPAAHGATLADEFVFPGAWVDVHGSAPVVVGVAGMTRPRDLIYLEPKIEGKKTHEVITTKVDCLKPSKISQDLHISIYIICINKQSITKSLIISRIDNK